MENKVRPMLITKLIYPKMEIGWLYLERIECFIFWIVYPVHYLAVRKIMKNSYLIIKVLPSLLAKYLLNALPKLSNYCETTQHHYSDSLIGMLKFDVFQLLRQGSKKSARHGIMSIEA